MKGDPRRFNLYTESMLADLRPDTTLFRADNGKLVLQLKVLTSPDLQTWTETDAVEWETDLPAGKEFYRIQLSK